MAPITNNLNQRAYYDGREVTVKTYDKFTGKCTIVIDGETKIVDWNDLFGINDKKQEFADYYTEKLDKVTEQLNKAKENASFWGQVFDFNLAGVKSNRKDRMSFVREYGKDLSAMSAEQQEEYKALLAKGSDYSSAKNTALGRQLSYTNEVISIAGQKQNLLNQVSLFNAMLS